MSSKIIILSFASILVLATGDLGSKNDFTAKVQASTKTLGGINCLVETVFEVENYASDFIYDIQVCKVTPSEVVAKIRDLSKAITKRTAKVIDAIDKVCKYSAYNDSDAAKPASSTCTNTMNTRMDKLYDAVSDAYTYLNTDLDIEDSCSEYAANTLKLNLPILTVLVDSCA